MPGKKLIVLFTAAVMLLAALPALGAEVTRESYVEAVEPICKVNTEANEKILKGVRQKVKAGELSAAAKQVAAAAKALKKARAKLLQVPKPTADAALLTKWLGYVKAEVSLFEAVARKLAHHETTAAQKMVVRLYTNARQANNLVFEFQFRYCKFQPSKFL